jgi:hypothetical protein
MPLFPEVNTYYKGRTHTQLVISEGVAPAEKWIPAAAEAVKFQYAYGPEGNQNVVIPKGKIVTLSGLEWDYETEHYVPAIKIATEADNYVIGVNHHNVYERRRDRFSGNAPTVITREYIEVPLFTSEADAAAIKFGAAHITADNLATALGRFVKADNYGNFQLADPTTDSYGKVVGQILGIETEVPPAGFLQYFLEMTNNEYTDFVKQMSYAPSAGKAAGQGTFDIGSYPLGTSYLEAANRIRDWNKGIPRLTDGYFRARTHVVGITLDNAITAEAITAGGVVGDGTAIAGEAYTATDEQYNQVVEFKVSGDVTVTNGAVTVGADPRGAAIYIRLKDKLANDALKAGDTNSYPEFSGTNPANVEVKLGATTVADANVHIDYTNNMIVVYFTAAVTAQKLQIAADLLINATPGIPTGWDFKGAIGAARILLQR